MSNKSESRPGIVGAAIVPHAPQFLTLPDTEDKAQVGRVNAAMRAIGDRFRALDPDLLIVLSNAHCDDFVVHCVPAFMIHCGRRAEGSGGHKGGWPIDGEAGYALVQQLLDLLPHPLRDRRKDQIVAADLLHGDGGVGENRMIRAGEERHRLGP